MMKSSRRTVSAVMLLAAGLLLPGCGGRGNDLKITGSDTLLELSQAWAEEFQKQHPDIKVSVSGGGSSVGITALINGQTDIANASREMKDEETKTARGKGIDPVRHDVARDALSIIVHRDNPIGELTIAQLKEIYTGRITNWKQVGGADRKIVAASRDTSSGTYAYFKERVLDDADYASGTLHLASNVAITGQVEADTGSIGYVGIGYVTPKVKAVAIRTGAGSPAVMPTVDNARNGTYPLSRLLHQYTNGKPTGAAKQWIDFVMGEEGQRIVKEHDFVPTTP